MTMWFQLLYAITKIKSSNARSIASFTNDCIYEFITMLGKILTAFNESNAFTVCRLLSVILFAF